MLYSHRGLRQSDTKPAQCSADHLRSAGSTVSSVAGPHAGHTQSARDQKQSTGALAGGDAWGMLAVNSNATYKTIGEGVEDKGTHPQSGESSCPGRLKESYDPSHTLGFKPPPPEPTLADAPGKLPWKGGPMAPLPLPARPPDGCPGAVEPIGGMLPLSPHAPAVTDSDAVCNTTPPLLKNMLTQVKMDANKSSERHLHQHLWMKLTLTKGSRGCRGHRGQRRLQTTSEHWSHACWALAVVRSYLTFLQHPPVPGVLCWQRTVA